MNNTEQGLKELIEACKLGTPAAQAQLFNRYFKSMFLIASRYATDQMEAEDIAMIAFSKILLKITSFHGNGSFQGWMKRILINQALSSIDQRKRSIPTTPLEDALQYGIRELEIDLDTDPLFSAFKALPGPLKIPLELYAIEGYSHKEIASRLGISVELSKTRVSRARKNIRERLQSKRNPVSALSFKARQQSSLNAPL